MTLRDFIVNEILLRIRAPRGGPLRSAAALRRNVEELRLRPVRYGPPGRLSKRAALAVEDRHGMPVYAVQPKLGTPLLTVVYLHGGAYVSEISRYHWRLAGFLASEVPARVIVPIYPLAPRGTAATVVPAIAELVREHAADGPTILMGDSAGGGLALAAAQVLRDAGGPSPAALVLIAPWLDVACDAPEQQAIERRDHMLRRPGLREAGRLWAAELGTRDPRVSPLHGDLSGLPPITAFSGARDILSVDAWRLAQLNPAVTLHADDEAPHVHPLLPTDQGEAARRTIVELCRRYVPQFC